MYRTGGDPRPTRGRPAAALDTRPGIQKGRFLNVFREDDKGTKAVRRFAEPVKASHADLIHALFFARWCNRDTTLNALDPGILKSPVELRHALLHKVQQPWSSEVYPVVPAQS